MSITGNLPPTYLLRIRKFQFSGTGGIFGRASRALFAGPAIIVPRKGSLGNPQFVSTPFWAADTTYVVLPKPKVDARWLYYNLDAYDLTKLNEATGVPSINRDWLYRIKFEKPSFDEQRRIAEILRTADEAMEQAETWIVKHRQIKAGLMHDLFTRGVTPDGHLRLIRAQAPQLYKNEPLLGWIPKEWKTLLMKDVAESVVDGPFGSNLKTEHYVIDPGVRVVRLQNIDEGQYNDSERAFVSERHASFLSRNQVVGGDVLIAGLGEDKNVVGRACCYPLDLPPAINKADCFRLRCHSALALNSFVMSFLNTAHARRQIRRFEQGVTRRRINTGNLKKVWLGLPPLAEQRLIVQMLSDAEKTILINHEAVAKLRQEKLGLMQDLLKGRVQIKIAAK